MGSAAEVFAIPQIGVVELVRVSEDVRHRIEEVQGARFFRLRDTLLPLVSLADRLQLADSVLPDEYNIIVCQVGRDTHRPRRRRSVRYAGDRGEAGRRLVKHLPVYAGCTILGDGRVIMILDSTGIANEALAVTHAEQAAATATETETDADAATESVLVFDAGGSALQAVPLSLVARLEEVPADQIEEADGRALVQYRGALLPLLPASPAMNLRARSPRPVIVFTDNGRSMGLAVDEIRDIVDARLTLDQGRIARACWASVSSGPRPPRSSIRTTSCGRPSATGSPLARSCNAGRHTSCWWTIRASSSASSRRSCAALATR